MTRSIFSILKKFNFNLFLINFIFIFLIYFFGFFSGGFVGCDDLIKTVYNNINIRYSPTLSSFRLHSSIDFFQSYILNTPGSHFKFNIFKYLQLDGTRFPRNSVYDHFHLNLYLDNMYNVHYNFPLTHNFKNLGLLLHEYKEFSKLDLYNQKILQYVMNNLYVYDLNLLKIEDYTDIFNKYINVNRNKCVEQFKNIIK